MKNARLFRENQKPILVSAEQVRDGLYNRYEEFVDPEYEFKVQYVKGAKNNGGPYFRLYYSYEEYKKLYPDRADRYEIVANMLHYQESEWHKRWKKNVSEFCSIEKCIKNDSTNKWKFADAFYDETKTCIEFQHSYINWDFEERNEFYSNLSIKTIWLYDLPKTNARENSEGNIDILENNARGFFRISENPDNLKNHRVYVQVKSGMIYRISELLRHESSTDLKSTIRYFTPTEKYTEDEFISAIKNNTIGSSINTPKTINNTPKAIKNTPKAIKNTPKTIKELWSKDYSSMVIENIENGDQIQIYRGPDNEIYRSYDNGCIQYEYVDGLFRSFGINNKRYSLSHKDEKRSIWILVRANNRKK